MNMHGNSVAAYDAMGRPEGSLTRDQIAKLQKAGAMASAEPVAVKGGMLRSLFRRMVWPW